jgi:hypothetical protein
VCQAGGGPGAESGVLPALPCRAVPCLCAVVFFVSSIHGPSLRGSNPLGMQNSERMRNSERMQNSERIFPFSKFCSCGIRLGGGGVGEPECGAHVEVVKEVRP